MIRSILSRGAIAAGLALALAGSAWAQQAKPAAKPATAPAKPAAGQKPAAAAPAVPQGQPVQIATFGDWGVFASDTQRGRVCYALSQPKERLPKDLKRDPGYLFISTRPSEGVRNEISIITGFPTKNNADGEMTIGATRYVLVQKDNSAWLKNPAEDPAALETMKKGTTLTAKTTSLRGNATTDRYSLNGLGQALERVKKECP
jgi:hypothetical protein